MPAALTYPGVYVEEILSGVHTITGVATSITAFIGRAMRGPTDEAVAINSFGDFERVFGGLWADSTLGYAVRDFYANGGKQSLIVRLYHPEFSSAGAQASAAAATAAPITKASLLANGLGLEAKSEGAWGNTLRARVDHEVVGPNMADLFNLHVRDGTTGQVERFQNVSVVPGHVRQVDKVLSNDSTLVNMTGPLPMARPVAHSDPSPGKDVWGDYTDATNSKVAPANQASDGSAIDVNDFTGRGKEENTQGLYALNRVDLFNILCIPPYLDTGNVDYATLVGTAAAYCEHRRAMLLVDPPVGWNNKDSAKRGVSNLGTSSKNAALFFPRLTQPNPLHNNLMEDFVPCGAVAGVFARTDGSRGVWKAPAGLDAVLVAVPQLSVPLNDAEMGELNPLGINCLRTMPGAGRVVWGSRTLQGDDNLASEWKYIPVRRTALFIEESLYRGIQWVVFEPNHEPLWASIRLNIGAFMHTLFRQGAFQGSSPMDAYFVKCDKETTTQTDIDLGIVKIVVGFAPLKPAEFVVIQLQHVAGQIAA